MLCRRRESECVRADGWRVVVVKAKGGGSRWGGDVTQAPPPWARGGRESPRIYEGPRGRHLAERGPKHTGGGHYETMIGWSTGRQRQWLIKPGALFTLDLFWNLSDRCLDHANYRRMIFRRLEEIKTIPDWCFFFGESVFGQFERGANCAGCSGESCSRKCTPREKQWISEINETFMGGTRCQWLLGILIPQLFLN